VDVRGRDAGGFDLCINCAILPSLSLGYLQNGVPTMTRTISGVTEYQVLLPVKDMMEAHTVGETVLCGPERAVPWLACALVGDFAHFHRQTAAHRFFAVPMSRSVDPLAVGWQRQRPFNYSVVYLCGSDGRARWRRAGSMLPSPGFGHPSCCQPPEKNCPRVPKGTAL